MMVGSRQTFPFKMFCFQVLSFPRKGTADLKLSPWSDKEHHLNQTFMALGSMLVFRGLDLMFSSGWKRILIDGESKFVTSIQPYPTLSTHHEFVKLDEKTNIGCEPNGPHKYPKYWENIGSIGHRYPKSSKMIQNNPKFAQNHPKSSKKPYLKSYDWPPVSIIPTGWSYMICPSLNAHQNCRGTETIFPTLSQRIRGHLAGQLLNQLHQIQNVGDFQQLVMMLQEEG